MPVPALIPAIGSIAGLIGNIFGGRDSKQQTTQQLTRLPEDAALADLLRSRFTDRLSSPTPIAGLESSGISNINSTFGNIRDALNARITSRGLGRSPAGFAGEQSLELARGGEIARFLNDLPLVQRGLQDQDFAAVSNFLNIQPQTQTSTARIGGNKLGATFGGIEELLGVLDGLGVFGRGGTWTGLPPKQNI